MYKVCGYLLGIWGGNLATFEFIIWSSVTRLGDLLDFG